jgi:DNA-binding response OmpR family regulator
MNHVKVLCVENQPEHLDVLTYMLEMAGYDVMSATTGRQGISLLAKNTVQGVLLEYDLPDSTGTAVRAEMKKIKPDVPVLLFAGVGSQTPFLLKFFDAYLKSEQPPESVLWDLDS